MKHTTQQLKTLFAKTPPETPVEVFKYSYGQVRKKVMTFEEFLNLENDTNVKYVAYQVGFCSIKTTI